MCRPNSLLPFEFGRAPRTLSSGPSNVTTHCNLAFDFTTLIGPPARWREIANFPSKDSLQFSVFGEKEGKWVPVVQQAWRRKQPEGGMNSLVSLPAPKIHVSQARVELANARGGPRQPRRAWHF
jgi:hypothetical protein